MKFPMEAILRAALLGTLYVLAAPVYIVLGTVRLGRLLTAFSVFATCNRCHATEYGSLLYCSFCRQVTHALACEQCGVTLRVIPKGWW